jgi:hypothetical protein
VIGYPRPKGAGPIRASLVPAYQACTSSNRSHGAPLSYPSCAPPVASSSVLTVGTPDANGFAANSIDSVEYKVLSNDVSVDLSMTDIRNKPSGTDYTGRVLIRAPLQITDRNNSAELPATGTVQTLPLEFPATCVATASAAGSTCSIATTVNAQIAGTVVAGQRSIWEFGQIEIRDAGPNGTGYGSCPLTCGDGDEATFMRQGIFIP